MAELIEKVVQQLGQGTVAADLLTVPETVLLSMIETESSAAQAAFFVALGRLRRAAVDGAELLATQFAKQEQRTREPWRLAVENAAVQRKAAMEVPLLKLQEMYRDIATKGGKGTMTAEDVLTVTYLLHVSGPYQLWYAHTVLNKVGFDRVQAHNLFVVSQMPQAETWLLDHGEHVVTLPVPLFPPDREFDSTNLQLMREYRAWVELQTPKNPRGGGRMATSNKFTSCLYKKSAQGGEVEGGGSLPVVAAADGQGWVVDTTPIEDAFGAVFATLNALSADVASAKAETKALVAKAKEQLAKTRQVFRTTTASHNRGGRGGRGRGRGGYRGRGVNGGAENSGEEEAPSGFHF